jgi:GNAT superfamily N-acetyltransferase
VVRKEIAGDIDGQSVGNNGYHEDTQVIVAFAGTIFPLNELYYVGELLFSPAYRNCGLGQKLLDRFESHIRPLGRYRTLACAKAERSDDHPLRPHDYINISKFLALPERNFEG